MGFLYPRTISIRRPNARAGIGAQPYRGVATPDEAVVATGLPASIQEAGSTADDTRLPADARKTMWRILIPKRAAALGTIRARDIVTDDLGGRYQVGAPYWNSLGYNVTAERLEA